MDRKELRRANRGTVYVTSKLALFAKHQIFSTIDKMASDDPARSDGTAVKQALSDLIERFPDLRATEDA